MGRVASPYVPDDADRQLLRLLLAGGPVSGEEMSRELNMTRRGGLEAHRAPAGDGI